MSRREAQVEIRTLGPIEVWSDSGTVETPLPKGQRRILGILASQQDGGVSLDRLIDVLQVSKAAVHTAVSRLRTSIGNESVATTRDGYALGDVDLDATRFCELVARAADMSGVDRETTLRAALELWRGEPFAEFVHEDWTRVSAVRLDEIHSAAVEDHADALVDLGRAGDAAVAMTAHIDLHPLRDRPRAILMSALSAQGRTTEALRVARDYRKHLGETVGTEPTSAFDDVERSIASGERHVSLLSNRATRADATNVGPELNQFVDRPEIDQVAELLGSARLVTLVGPGGIGKSRSAIAIARRVTEGQEANASRERPGGVWFVDLSTADERAVDVALIVSQTLGLQRQAGLTLPEMIVSFVRERPMLLVLDNCEHVLASARELTEELLAQCPKLDIVATSRVRMRTPFERVVDVGPMSSASAVELFERRVAECGAGPFPRHDVAQLCERLDNYPLALELAAARTRVQSPAEIIDRLDVQLTSRPVDTPPRHSSLGAALEWSLDQLDGDATALLHSMAVFRGPFDAAAAHAIVGADVSSERFLECLDELIEQHLLRRDHTTARFRLLEPIRQHLLRTRPLPDELEERHARYFASFVRDAVRGMFTADERVSGRALRLSLPDVRACVGWAIVHEDPALVELMMERMALVVSAEVFIEGGEWAEQALTGIGADAADMPATALAAASGLFWLERLEESERLFDRVAATVTDPELIGVQAMAQGFVAIFSGDFPRAVERSQRCGEIGRMIGEPLFELQPLVVETDPRAVAAADRLGSPSRAAAARWFAWLSLDVEARGRSKLPDVAVDLAFESGSPYAIAQGLSFLASRLLRAGDVARGAGELANAVERMVRIRAPMLVWAAIDQSASALAIISGHEDGAVTLWSALEAAGRASTGQAYMVPGTVEAARAALSSRDLEMAESVGSVLTMDSAVEFALEHLDKIAAG